MTSPSKSVMIINVNADFLTLFKHVENDNVLFRI